MNVQEIKEDIISSLKEFFKSAGKAKAVIGLSGGLDSAVCLSLITRAIGKENVTALFMPEIDLTSKENEEDSYSYTQELDVDLIRVPINSYLDNLEKIPWKQTDISIINTKARIRMIVLYNYANANDSLVIGTGNKSEIYLGYNTKFGDSAVDILPIGDLYKTQVFELAKELNIPESIINKTPSAELMKGQTDEKDLNIKYEIADKIISNIISKNMSRKEIIESGFKEEDVDNVLSKIKNSEHKRRTALIIKIDKKC